MNFQDVKPDKAVELVKQFYVIQKVLLCSPVGSVVENNTPLYPIYFDQLQNKLKNSANELEKFDIHTFPIQQTETAQENWLSNLTSQFDFKIGLKLGDETIQPPKNIDNYVAVYVQQLSTPWR